MDIKYEISADRSTLTLIASDTARADIADLRNDGFRELDEVDALEHLIANSELDWLDSEDTGDLTDAPILGLTGEPQKEESGPHGSHCVGYWSGSAWYQPILERWGYPQYQVKSFLKDLLDTGRAEFRNNW